MSNEWTAYTHRPQHTLQYWFTQYRNSVLGNESVYRTYTRARLRILWERVGEANGWFNKDWF